MAGSAPRSVWRQPRWWLLAAAVLLVHVLLRERLAEALLPPELDAPMQRLGVVYTRQITPSSPPPAAVAPPVRRRRSAPPGAPVVPAETAEPAGPADPADVPEQAAAEAASAASAPEPGSATADAQAAAASGTLGTAAAASEPSEPPAPAATPATAASLADVVAPAPPDPIQATAADAASVAAPLPLGSAVAADGATPATSAASATMAGGELLYGAVWPYSTRLRYRLNGWYRGEVTGDAQVEWLRVGTRYQVHLEVTVGPSFAPLVSRRMSSEGRITPDGLAPQRYEQETRQPFGRSRIGIRFEPELVRLAQQRIEPRPADVQDTASQFIQMIYLLTARPELREKGASVQFALALPHRIDRWTYDIGPAEQLETPAGPLAAIHIRPRRRVVPGALAVQMWLAPELQLLPVRIRIEQDDETWVNLELKALPEQAGS